MVKFAVFPFNRHIFCTECVFHAVGITSWVRPLHEVKGLSRPLPAPDSLVFSVLSHVIGPADAGPAGR